MYNPADTICAPATAVGSGAVSMIRVSGADSLCAVDRVVHFDKGSAADSRGYTLKHGNIPGVDEVVVGIYRAPHSYTGEDSAEICCHASPFIASRILGLLCEAGCRLAGPGEFTRRAFTNGKMDLAQAEAVADLIASGSEAQHRVALNQLRGGYSAELAEIRSELLELTSLIELELDFSEEEVEFADRDRLASLLDDVIGRCTTLADSFKAGNAIRNGVPVAIVGAPNSGKSTLLNALLRDDRALVSDIPGTTRDTIEETCVVGGVLLRFIDTAGIRETRDEVERMGIDRALSKAAQAEIVLGVVDAAASSGVDADDDRTGKETGTVVATKIEMEMETGMRMGMGMGIASGSVPPHDGFHFMYGSSGKDCPVPLTPEVSAFTDCAEDTPLLPDGIAAQIEKIASAVDLSRQKLVLLLNKCDKAENAAAGPEGSVSPRSGQAPLDTQHTGLDSSPGGGAFSYGQTLPGGEGLSSLRQTEPDSPPGSRDLSPGQTLSSGEVPSSLQQAASDFLPGSRILSHGQTPSSRQVPSNPQYAVSASGSVDRSMELRAFLRGRFPAVAFFDENSSCRISDSGVSGEAVFDDKLSDGRVLDNGTSEDVVSAGRFLDHRNSNDVISVDNKNVSYTNINVLTADYQKNNPIVLSISAKYGIGLEDLRKVLVSLVGDVPADGVLVTNARHAAALRDAAASLRAVRSGLDALPGDLLAEDLRAALASLGSITGEICPDEVLGAIFSRFCIGK